MAHPASCSHHQQLPVTPPADNDSFKGLFPPHTPHKLEQQPMGIFDIMNALNNPNTTTTLQSPNYHHQQQQQQQQQQRPPLQPTPPPQTKPPPPSHSQLNNHPQPSLPAFPTLPTGPIPHLHDRAGNPIDPRYVAMASRIAAYYQQRCQAVANYQQQRCQQWAALQRQKCQDMMQAAMLVVAWYIRDRIQRRRRRQKHAFRRGLSRKSTLPGGSGGIRKGETVRRWVLDVPDDVLSAGRAEHEELKDPEERRWDADREEGEGGKDKDAKLFRVADDLIRSQVTKIDVPLMGMLGFDQDESESESESEEEEEDYEMEEEEEYEEYDDEEDEDGDDDEVVEQVVKKERMGSQEVQVSSGKNSRKRTRSSCDS